MPRPDGGPHSLPQSTSVLGISILWLVFHRAFLPMVMRSNNAVLTIAGICDAATIACALALGLNRTCRVNVT